MNIALKEANEKDYWLSLLKDSGYIDEKQYRSLNKEINELISMLVSTVKTLKSKQ